jgi:hypothetical protein
VVEVDFATVDHSDIHVSKPHNRDPLGAASDYKCGFGPKTYRIELSRILHPVSLTPGISSSRPLPHRRSPGMPQQKLIQPMPCSQFILLGLFSYMRQIPRCLVSRLRYSDRRQASCPIIHRQFQCISPTCFHAVPCFHRHQSGRHHHALGPHLGQLADESGDDWPSVTPRLCNHKQWIKIIKDRMVQIRPFLPKT